MRRICTLTLVLMLACAFACPAFAARELVFVTGRGASTYNAYGSVLAQYISDHSDVSVTAVTGNGSAANIDELDLGFSQLALVQNDIASYAYNGTRFDMYIDNPVTSFKALAALYTESVQLVTCNPEIKSVADLKGKKVAVGAVGSAVYYNAMDFLAAYNMTEADIFPQYLSFGDSVEALKDGKFDAAFIVYSAPASSVWELCEQKGAYLIGLDQDAVARLQEISPFYAETTIPAGTYAGNNSDILTVGVKATIIANDQVTDEEAYAIVSTIFENKETIAQLHYAGRNLDVSYASFCGLPYHAGALRYFEEKGILQGEVVRLPEGLKFIGPQAFANCTDMERVYIPAGVTEIAEEAFVDCREDLIILGSKGSTAESFALAHGYKFVSYIP